MIPLQLPKDFNDERGNSLHINMSGIVHFTAQGDREKMIGKIVNEGDRLVYIKDEVEKHILRKMTAWTVHNDIYQLVDRIVYTTKKATYSIDKEKARNLRTKFTMNSRHFKGELFLKATIPIDLWDKEYHDPSYELRMKTFGYGWYAKLEKELRKPYFMEIKDISMDNSITPKPDDIFRCFSQTPFENVKVAIIGNAPYCTPNIADGLAFSTKSTRHIPDTLKNIFKELEDTMDICRTDPNLEDWAAQGIFLYNTALTTLERKKNAHTYLWKQFTASVISALNNRIDTLNGSAPILFVLWGHEAHKYEKMIKRPHKVIKAAHPSPLSAKKGFFGCNHFQIISEWFTEKYFNQVKWVSDNNLNKSIKKQKMSKGFKMLELFAGAADRLKIEDLLAQQLVHIEEGAEQQVAFHLFQHNPCAEAKEALAEELTDQIITAAIELMQLGIDPQAALECKMKGNLSKFFKTKEEAMLEVADNEDLTVIENTYKNYTLFSIRDKNGKIYKPGKYVKPNFQEVFNTFK